MKLKQIQLSLPPALQFPAYRNFWLGMFGAVGGFQVLMFGQFWLMHELTGSPLHLGYVGVANAIPAILLNLFGGVIADKADKKKLIIWTETLSASLVFLLGLLTVLGVVEVWHVIAIAVVSGAINAFNQPARQALYPHLVDREALTSAVALNAAVWTGTRIVAPAIAGILIATLGTASSFFFACAGMLIFSLVIYFLKVPEIKSTSSGNPAQDLMEGLRFIKNNSIFLFLISMAFFNSFFGMAYVTQMPVFTREILIIDADGQGLLLSLNGIGSLMMTLYWGLRRDSHNKGLILIGGASLAGLSLAAFSLSSHYVGSFLLASILMFWMGISNSTFLISVMSSLQMMVPNEMRGRVMGFWGITWNIYPLGGLYAGILAGFIGMPSAIAIGGMLVVIFAVGPALLNPQIRNLGTLLESESADT